MNGLGAIYNPEMGQQGMPFGVQPPVPPQMPMGAPIASGIPSPGQTIPVFTPTDQLAQMNQQEAQRQRESSNIIGAAQKIASSVVGSKDTGDIMKPMSLVTAGGQAPSSSSPAESEPQGGQENVDVVAMKGGGVASAAQQVQNQGRGEDKVLVHMTPNEVRGLQAIAMQHGGSLTINPKTGLVEAGFLDSILPMVAGAALTATGVGAPLAALMVGGGTALMTGSLERGLFAGLGAFGGANLAAGLGQAGAAGAATTAGAPVTAASQTAAAITPQAATAVPGALPAGGGKFLQAAGTQMIPQGAASLAPAGSTAALQTAAAGAPQGFMANVSQMGKGLSNVVQGAPGAREAFMQTVGGPMGLATKVAGPVAAGMFTAEEEREAGKKPQEYIRPYSFDYKPSAETDPNFKFRTGAAGESTAEQRYFTPTYTGLGVYKAGTEPGPSFYGTPTQEQLALYSKPRPGSEINVGRDDDEGLFGLGVLGLSGGGVAGLGKGGLKDGAFIVPADVVAHLGNGSNDAGQKLLARGLGARPIKGKGDGMSDSISTSIEGKQPARVADGEAYIPPEVVKKVGSKRLYDMMAKIRKARTNTTKQAPEVDPRKFMPA
jgi:hypothetical protein